MAMEAIFLQAAQELNLKEWQVRQTVDLIDAGNTIPFIARYRKEQTGELNEILIAGIAERVKYLRELADRKQDIIRMIAEQGKLSPELEVAIRQTTEKQQLEDLYRPFRPKRKTRASVAREKDLEPLARAVAEGKENLDKLIVLAMEGEYVTTREEAIQGALDILAEEIADDPQNRRKLRDLTWRKGVLAVSAKDKEQQSVYEPYYDYREPLKDIPAHRILAINRGEKEGLLKVKIEVSSDEALSLLHRRHVDNSSPTASYQIAATDDAYRRLLAPAIERELRKRLTDRAEEKALEVFADNLHHLLLQPPIRDKVVLAIDPAYRTGCKWAVVTPTGALLETGVIYPTPPQEDTETASAVLREVITRYSVTAICIGNGTASRETEIFLAETLAEMKNTVPYTIINEAGASVYSASALAREEFPELDVSQRSAISLARRLQDPLAELVKIDPRSLGVGQYQHDVNSKTLEQKLSFVVETVVNRVGVNLNTASTSLLEHVAGLNRTMAKNIVIFRSKVGRFTSRDQLSAVAGLGPKTFEQCVGFLRIAGGPNPLDNTPIHPESYGLASRLLALLGLEVSEPGSKKLRAQIQQLELDQLARKLNAGLPTLKDTIEALSRPGRDPRDDIPPPIFRTDVIRLEDLKPGMKLQGTVRNVIDFGAFVDIGVKQDGLIHISQLANRFVRHPSEEVAVGDVVAVTVLNVDLERGRISLSMKQ